MMKRTSPLNSSREIKSHCQISSNFEIVEISHFSRHRMSGDTWHDMWCTYVHDSHEAKCKVEKIMGNIKQEK